MRVIVAGAVIMTGATTVMGLATARLLAAEGADALPAAARSRLSRLGLPPAQAARAARAKEQPGRQCWAVNPFC